MFGIQEKAHTKWRAFIGTVYERLHSISCECKPCRHADSIVRESWSGSMSHCTQDNSFLLFLCSWKFRRSWMVCILHSSVLSSFCSASHVVIKKTAQNGVFSLEEFVTDCITCSVSVSHVGMQLQQLENLAQDWWVVVHQVFFLLLYIWRFKNRIYEYFLFFFVCFRLSVIYGKERPKACVCIRNFHDWLLVFHKVYHLWAVSTCCIISWR